MTEIDTKIRELAAEAEGSDTLEYGEEISVFLTMTARLAELDRLDQLEQVAQTISELENQIEP